MRLDFELDLGVARLAWCGCLLLLACSVAACELVEQGLDNPGAVDDQGAGPVPAAPGCLRELPAGGASTAALALPARLAPTRHVYYVRPTGDDRATGTRVESAFASIARVNQQALAPGDRVLFEAGNTYSGSLHLSAAQSGSEAAPVVIGSFGAGRATLDAGSGSAIYLDDAAGFTIENLILRGGWESVAQRGSEDDSAGVRAENRSGARLSLLRLSELDISGFKAAGILLAALPEDDRKGAGFSAVSIEDCDVHDNGDAGVISFGPFTADPGYSHRDIRLSRVRCHDNRGLAGKRQHTGSGIELSDVEGARVERSIAYRNGELNDFAGGGAFGIWAWDSSAVLFQYNEAYDNRSQTADGGGFDLDGGVTHSLMQFNYSHENHGAGYGAFQFSGARPFADNAIRYNISQNDGAALLAWDGNGDMGRLDAYHNVGYGSRPAVLTYSPFADLRLLDNIFAGPAKTLLDIADGAGLTLQGNAYWAQDTPFQIAWGAADSAPRHFASLDAFRSATGQETADAQPVGLQVDPELQAPGMGPTLDDPDRLVTLTMYQLSADSPLIDRAVALEPFGIAPSCLDFFGGPARRGAASDIGAHERR